MRAVGTLTDPGAKNKIKTSHLETFEFWLWCVGKTRVVIIVFVLKKVKQLNQTLIYVLIYATIATRFLYVEELNNGINIDLTGLVS